MFTAEILDKAFVNGVIEAQIKFTDGTDVVTDTFKVPTIANLKEVVSRRLVAMDAAKADEGKLATGSFDATVTPVSPTAKEVAEKEWLANYYKWLRVKTTLIDTGILDGTETKVVALQNKVKTDFLPAYLDSIS